MNLSNNQTLDSLNPPSPGVAPGVVGLISYQTGLTILINYPGWTGTWAFYRSIYTETVGPSPRLREFLGDSGINVKVFYGPPAPGSVRPGPILGNHEVAVAEWGRYL